MAQENAYDPVFIARQPVFDRHSQVYGHLMLFRDRADAEQALISDDSGATMQVVAGLPQITEARGRDRILIIFTHADVIRAVPEALPPDRTVVVIEETAAPSPKLVEAVRALRDKGYAIAVNDYTGVPGGEPLANLADIAVINLPELGQAEAERLVRTAAEAGIPQTLAKRIETAQQHQDALDTGFSLFHGYYYKEPVPREDRTITSAEITRLKLFEIIERQEPDFDALAKAVETDVSISYRLLNFLNSAHFSFAANITSIRQAVVLAGWNPIRNWLRLIILTDMAPSRKNQELTLLSAVRAKLFESSAMNYGHAVDEADKLFMLGLFSLLDAMLDMDMAAIVEHLPIEDQCKQALCRKRNEYSTWLDLASAIENSEWPLMNEAAGRLGISPGAVAVSYQQAFSWANTFFGAIPASS